MTDERPSDDAMEDIGNALRLYFGGENTAEDLLSVRDKKMFLAEGIEGFPLPVDTFGSFVMGIVAAGGEGVVDEIRDRYRETSRNHAQLSASMMGEQAGRMIELWEDLGYGSVSISVVDDGGSRTVTPGEVAGAVKEENVGSVVVEVKNSLEARALAGYDEEVSVPVCMIWPGFLRGCMDVWYEGEHTYSEEACEARQADVCRHVFELE